MASDSVLRNFVNGKSVEPIDGGYRDLVDPCTGEVFAQAPVSGPADVDAAMRAAAAAFESWRDSTPGDRQRALLRIADALEDEVGQRPDEVESSGVLKGEVGATQDCTLTAGSDELGVKVTVTEVDGSDVNFDYVVEEMPS